MFALPAPVVMTAIWQELVVWPFGDKRQDAGTKTIAFPPVFRKDTDPAGVYPVTVAVQKEVLPTVTVEGAQPIARLLWTGFTANVKVAIAVLMLESVTVRVTVSGDPVVAVGVQVIEGELDVEHPFGRLVHA